ncbi:outer membrane beta-barrel protein [Belliella sp. DSM 111904]|uniref:Outer membrane beta-barrel protein n=1 Tax=Belliella filtrata TaxID=2923435 RepID=A0ABS9V5T6_9BACT|nr:outer membrane beta-barrel protein [Belliella filtrata]MCH7411325.1 outer membrane beta-barrel protein [Belliella filtrata]
MNTKTIVWLFISVMGIAQAIAERKGLEGNFSYDNVKYWGKVKDNQGEPLPFANVVLLHSESRLILVGAVTDFDGNFEMVTSTEFKEAIFKVSAIGFDSYEEVVKSSQKNLGTILLKEEISTLEEVTVKASRPEITVFEDKTLVNVEGSAMAEGSNALQIIGRSPGVFIDNDNRIQLNGKSGVLVMIDDKQTYMSPGDLASYLTGMPADNIKSIEIIANPSAKFDAEGAGGVINIRLKKNNMNGTHGSMQIGGGYNGLPNRLVNTSLNHKSGKWRSSLNLNYSNQGNLNTMQTQRNFAGSESSSSLNQEANTKRTQESMLGTASLDYDINDKHSLGGNLQVNHFNQRDKIDAMTDIQIKGQQNNDNLNTNNEGSQLTDRAFANIHYIGLLDTLGTKLTADLDYSIMGANNQNQLSNVYTTGKDGISSSNILDMNNEMYYSILTTKVDFLLPLQNGSRIETGIKGSWVKSQNDLTIDRKFEDENVEPISYLNNFRYGENVWAAYVNYGGSLSKKVNLQAGLRAEHTSLIGRQLVTGELNSSKYLDWFPSIFIGQKVSDNYQINYNINRRLTRPNYRFLNPAVFFLDELTQEQGNPELTPMYAHTAEVSQVWKNAYQFTLGYTYTTDIIQVIALQDDQTRVTTLQMKNLENMHNFSARMILPIEITPWWTTNNMLQAFYNSFNSQIGNDMLENTAFSIMARTQHNITLPGNFKLEMMGMYVGPQVQGAFRFKGFAYLDAGISKSWRNDQYNLSVTGRDIFRSQHFRGEMQFANVDTRFSQYFSLQGVRLTFRYKFSNGQSFSVSQRSGSSEERSRLD